MKKLIVSLFLLTITMFTINGCGGGNPVMREVIEYDFITRGTVIDMVAYVNQTMITLDNSVFLTIDEIVGNVVVGTYAVAYRETGNTVDGVTIWYKVKIIPDSSWDSVNNIPLLPLP